jgi:hypothetical protein
MSEQLPTLLPFLGSSTPLASEGPMRSVKHSLPNSEPMTLKCMCPGTKVPFYCPVHGRVGIVRPTMTQQQTLAKNHL